MPYAAQKLTSEIASPGALSGVDWENRVDFPRLREYRRDRIQQALAGSDVGSMILFDMDNIRYATAGHIGNWARDKLFRAAVVMRDRDPIHWDIGSAAKQHQMHSPWLPEENWQATVSSWRGAIPPEAGIEASNAKRIARDLKEAGLSDQPVGVDIVEMPVLRALEAEGLHVVNAQQIMQKARAIKSFDEIALLDQACGMVDTVYDEIARRMKIGMRENDVVAFASAILYEMGSEEVTAINSISGERCSPHPHVFSDRVIRPGDMLYFDIIHSFMGYRTCYYRTFNVGGASRAQIDAYKRTRYYIDKALTEVRPGVTSDQIAQHFPAATEFGFDNEEQAFGLQYCHGVGVGLWETPLISRYHSFDSPVTIEEGMMFAIETYWPAADGYSAARIEEEVWVTDDGPVLLTRFPSEELLVLGQRYWNGHDFAKGHNEIDSNPSLGLDHE
jgi:Xaa-Pro aminopeptidase